uniref:Uncharacterized protein n=1 Tax=viral metagenome TaxID=1070528 RepID=A0A6H1ZCJ6_9ZZZZ
MNPIIIKNWKISGQSTCLIVENTKTGFCDWLILYPDGGVAYDHPEQIPEYVKKYIREHQFEIRESISK